MTVARLELKAGSAVATHSHHNEQVCMVLAGKVKLKPFVETHPLADINRVFAAVHHREIKRRAVLVPA